MSASVTFPLPDGWSVPEAIEDTIVAGGVTIHRAGFSAKFGEREVCGSAADWRGRASSRAWFELLERIGCDEASRSAQAVYPERRGDGTFTGRTLSAARVFPESDAPEQWRYARSNGVAIHRGWEAACERARWELAERDRVLRSWYGEVEPVRLDARRSALPFHESPTHDWRLCVFPQQEPSGFSSDVQVVGVFGLPLVTDGPFVLGLAGRPFLDDAIEAASGEAVQQIAFLWGEPLPTALPTQPGPMLHLDTFQLPDGRRRLLQWLDGDHRSYRRRPRPLDSNEVTYVDLTPSWLEDGLRIAKAICPAAVALTFGDSPLAAHLPPELRVHPIC